jgi:predicted Zn-dependent protease
MKNCGQILFSPLTVAILLPFLLLRSATAAQITNAADLRPEDAALFQQAIKAQRDGNLPAAESNYRNLLTKAPEFLPARFNLGLLLDAAGKTAEAFEAFNTVAKVEPDFPAVQMFIGIEEFRLGRAEAAKSALELATKQNPNDLRCWFWLARIDFALEKKGEGKAALDRALAIAPGDPSALYLLAQYEVSMQDLTGAERVLSGLATRYPRIPDFHQSLGSVYYLEARLDSAEDEYRAELKLDPGNPQALSMMGVILLDRGQAKQAIPYLAKGLEANPHIAYLQRKMGQALLESGDTEQAVGHLKQATALDSQEASAHFLLWKAYRALDRRNDAARELDLFRKLQSQPKTAAEMPGIPAGGALRP